MSDTIILGDIIDDTFCYAVGNRIRCVHAEEGGLSHLGSAEVGASIRSISLSPNVKNVCAVTEDKKLYLWTSSMSPITMIDLPRRPTKVRHSTHKDDMLLVSTTTGNLIEYIVTGEPPNVSSKVIFENPSIITDFALGEADRVVSIGDISEKIRTCKFPECYDIKFFSLGHTRYLTRVEVCSELILSTSADGSVILWSLEDGRLIDKVVLEDGVHILDLAVSKSVSCIYAISLGSAKLFRVAISDAGVLSPLQPISLNIVPYGLSFDDKGDLWIMGCEKIGGDDDEKKRSYYVVLERFSCTEEGGCKDLGSNLHRMEIEKDSLDVFPSSHVPVDVIPRYNADLKRKRKRNSRQ